MTEPETHALDVPGGEFGMKGDPDGFAATLRQVLTADIGTPHVAT